MRHVSRHLLIPACLAAAATLPALAGEAGTTPQHDRCTGTEAAGQRSPVPADPYPLMAAGWGPELGGGLMASRWAEDWTGMAAGEQAPKLKALYFGEVSMLTVSAEARYRYVAADNNRLIRDIDMRQGEFRGIVGADLRLTPRLRFYGELGTGQLDRDRASAAANFQNRAALQQLFVDVRETAGPILLGVMLGRQEFADGPRQLISLSDGPNLHRSWNGVRLYAHAPRYRIGAFELRATRLANGGFDEGIQSDTILRGVNGSVIVSRGEGPNIYLDPFWFHTELPGFRFGDEVGTDRRDTLGLRLWGHKRGFRWDWTAARQSGRSLGGRRINAWGVFAVQSLVLSEAGWKPKLTSHIDIASGGGLGDGGGSLRNFHPLYASSNYLGESQFLGLSNLMLVAPGIALVPSANTTLSFEYGHARRLDANDAAYAGGMRAYTGTQDISGHHIGNLMRLSGTWSPSTRLTFNLTAEHLAAGHFLRKAGFGSGTYAQFGATYRY
ncbi:alginate export family protein [Thermomonas fusca]